MGAQSAETCEECGFDASSWGVRDATGFFDALGHWWRLAIDGVEEAALNTRPAAAVWSALEYGLHTSLVTALHRVGIEMILQDDGVELPEIPTPADASSPLRLEPAAVVNDLEREGQALAGLARSAVPSAWRHTGTWAGETLVAEAQLLHSVHDASHHMMDVSRGLAAVGAGTPRGEGTVAQVNRSDGGVPKLAIGRGRVTATGLEGDAQADRKHHGRPFQALCLWSAEVLAELADEGHRIGPGSAGENLTLAGIDWASLRPGARLRIGGAVAELSFPATPCAKQAQWFTDGDFGRIDHARNPRLTRWYAWVREAGDVSPGDRVVVQP